MELFLVYLWLKLDTFLIILGIISIIGGAAVFIQTLVTEGGCWDKETYYKQSNYLKSMRVVKFWIACVILLFTLPTSKDMAILVGSSIAIDIAKSPEGTKISQLIRKKANDYLDEQLKEVKK